MKKQPEVPRDLITQQLVNKASPMPELKVDFTAQVMAQIEVQTQTQQAKIHEPLLSMQVWRWIGITLSSMVLLVLALSVLAFGPIMNFGLKPVFASSLKEFLTVGQLGYLPQLTIVSLICFCWLLLDYLYSQLRKS